MTQGGEIQNATGNGVQVPLRKAKPGWTARVFGIETGVLMACDAWWSDDGWQRGETFRFLYRSKRSKYFLLTAVQDWEILSEEQARTLYPSLPEQIMETDEAFAEPEYEPLPKDRDEDEDDRIYKVVRNDKWDFSIWLDYKELPAGWRSIDITGSKIECLDYIRKNCVFGSANPGIP